MVEIQKVANHRLSISSLRASQQNLKFIVRKLSRSARTVIMDIENEVYFLKEEIIRLKEENEGLQQDRKLAGEIGKNLLENNQELERKLEEVNNDYIQTLGSLEVRSNIPAYKR